MKGAELLIEGYASLFDRVDLGGDIVRRGAFTESLRRCRLIPMLYQHDPKEPVGVWHEIREDRHGLYVKGALTGEGPRGQRVRSLVACQALDGLSIGFKTRWSRPRRPHGRDLHIIDLWEVSIVTFPMLPQARLRCVRSQALAA